MRRVIVGVVAGLTLVMAPAATARAAPNPNGAGQPSQSCEDPGMQSPAGFATQGFANAASNYAGSEGTSSLNSGNAHAVSQYDVACFQITVSGH